MGWAVVEERTFDTMQPVIDQVPRSCRQFYSDGLNTYPTLLYYEGKHEALPDKSQTYSVEGSNAEIRHYLGGFTGAAAASAAAWNPCAAPFGCLSTATTGVACSGTTSQS